VGLSGQPSREVALDRRVEDVSRVVGRVVAVRRRASEQVDRKRVERRAEVREGRRVGLDSRRRVVPPSAFAASSRFAPVNGECAWGTITSLRSGKSAPRATPTRTGTGFPPE